MEGKKEGFPEKLAEKWPFRALNYLPAKYQLRFINWKCGVSLAPESFSLASIQEKKGKLLVFPPTHPREIYWCIPVLDVILRNWVPHQIAVVTPPLLHDYLQNQEWEVEKIPWPEHTPYFGDPEMDRLSQTLLNTGAHIAVHLESRRNLRHNYFLKTCGAALRIGIGPLDYPFCNFALSPAPEANIMGIMNQITRLFSHEDLRNWDPLFYFRTNPSDKRSLESQFQGKKIRPGKNILLFLWDCETSEIESQKKWLLSLKNAPAPPGEAKPQVIGTVLPGRLHREIPADILNNVPFFAGLNASGFLALLKEARGVVGFNSPGFHLGILTGKNCLGIYPKYEKFLQVSDYFSNLTVAEPGQEVGVTLKAWVEKCLVSGQGILGVPGPVF